jgi:hypothetical protein
MRPLGRLFRFVGRGADPGGRWAAEILRPLRDQSADCDVAPRVMSRILAERAQLPALTPRADRLAWIASTTLAASSLVFLLTTLLVLVRTGDEGVRETVGVGLQLWRVLALFGRVLIDQGAKIMAQLLPIARALLTILEVAAPFLRDAGIVAAIFGAGAILFSGYVFASARKTAPGVNLHGGTR